VRAKFEKTYKITKNIKATVKAYYYYILQTAKPAENDYFSTRGRLASKVAKSLLSANLDDGFVFGLSGAWGSGKTSFINFLKKSLRKKAYIVEISPWKLSDIKGNNFEENLTSLFFSQVKFALPWHKQLFFDFAIRPYILFLKQKAAGVERFFIPFFTFTSICICALLISDNLRELVSSLLLLEDFSQLPFLMDIIEKNEKTISNLDWFNAHSSLSISFTIVLSAVLLWLYFQTKDISADKKFKNIAKRFKSLRKPLVVIIDDLDRLQTSEIISIFQLVKNVGQLPNVIYILAFDKEIVVKNIAEIQNCDGDAYLEKIVQYCIDLPLLQNYEISDFFFKKIKDELEDSDNLGWNYERYKDLSVNCLRHYLKTPRNAIQLANSFQVNHEMMRGQVNVIDFLAIETLRLFEYKVWDKIRTIKDGQDNYLKEKLSSSNRMVTMVTEDTSTFWSCERQIEALLNESLNASIKDIYGTKEILDFLFIIRHTVPENHFSFKRWNGHINEPYKEREVIETTYLPLYFSYDSLYIPTPQEIKEAALDLCIDQNPNTFSQNLIKYQNNKMLFWIQIALNEKKDFMQENSEKLLHNFMVFSEDTYKPIWENPKESGNEISFTVKDHANFLEQYWKLIDNNKRLDLYKELSSKMGSLTLMHHLIPSILPLFSPPQSKEIVTTYLRRIITAPVEDILQTQAPISFLNRVCQFLINEKGLSEDQKKDAQEKIRESFKVYLQEEENCISLAEYINYPLEIFKNTDIANIIKMRCKDILKTPNLSENSKNHIEKFLNYVKSINN
jgi:predicted KAP-like P-loop ATPase